MRSHKTIIQFGRQSLWLAIAISLFPKNIGSYLKSEIKLVCVILTPENGHFDFMFE